MKTSTKTTVKNGVRVKITDWPGHGRVAEADCSCFGIDFRAHSTTHCPLFKKMNTGSSVEQSAEAALRNYLKRPECSAMVSAVLAAWREPFCNKDYEEAVAAREWLKVADNHLMVMPETGGAFYPFVRLMELRTLSAPAFNLRWVVDRFSNEISTQLQGDELCHRVVWICKENFDEPEIDYCS